MIPVPAIVYRLLGALVLAGGLFWWGWSKGAQSEQDKQAVAQAKAEREARKQEDVWQAKVYDLAYKLRIQEIAGEDARQDVLDGLTDGSVRVQPRLQCPKLPQAPGTTAGDDDSAPAGFTEADAGIALNIAADGDTYARRLYACQAYVRQIVGDE